VTTYLLDENVLRELRPGGNAFVQAWYATVSTESLRISAMTFFEKRRGAERLRKTDPVRAHKLLADINALEAAYDARLIPVDGPVVAEWTRLLGAKDKNQRDRALAATARVHGFIMVTRNVVDFIGCDVVVLDPFQAAPKPTRV
jgi:predicted nucleic acid-binding protein